jgi:CheY-like chemotaxis protein
MPDILVIDDDAIMRDLMADWLEAAGYAVRKAGDCRAGVAALEAALPALVVSDMWMPGPCGAEAIRRIRQKHPGVPLIAVSGHFGSGQGCSEQEALGAGAARTLAKPVKRAQLLGAVAELLGLPQR